MIFTWLEIVGDCEVVRGQAFIGVLTELRRVLIARFGVGASNVVSNVMSEWSLSEVRHFISFKLR